MHEIKEDIEAANLPNNCRHLYVLLVLLLLLLLIEKTSCSGYGDDDQNNYCSLYSTYEFRERSTKNTGK